MFIGKNILDFPQFLKQTQTGLHFKPQSSDDRRKTILIPFLQSQPSSPRPLRLKNTTTIPAHSSALVPTSHQFRRDQRYNHVVTYDTKQLQGEGLSVFKGSYEATPHKPLKILVTNEGDEDMFLPKKTVIAMAQQVALHTQQTLMLSCDISFTDSSTSNSSAQHPSRVAINNLCIDDINGKDYNFTFLNIMCIKK